MAFETVRGVITDVQRFSLYDGPGIRTTVFTKGCPLRCVWCHNPECIAPHIQLSYSARKCIGCGACAAACPHGVHVVGAEGHTLRWARCTGCGACVGACPTDALSLSGREVRAGDVLQEALRDRAYYESSGGGLTISGGEPLMQPDFTYALLHVAHAAGIHTCMETSGVAPWAALERMLPVTTLFLFDWKSGVAARHKARTGAPQRRIEENLDLLLAGGAQVVLRMPLVPGVNDTPEDLKGIAALLRRYPAVARAELMAYHRMGADKYAQHDLTYTLPDVPDMPEQRKVEILDFLRGQVEQPLVWG